jgi:hypothetical protein
MPRTEASRRHRFQVARAAPSGRAPGDANAKSFLNGAGPAAIGAILGTPFRAPHD